MPCSGGGASTFRGGGVRPLLYDRDVVTPGDLAGPIHSIKKRVLPSGMPSFDAERTTRTGHADRFWAIALACQKERGLAAPGRRVEVGVRVIG